MDSKLDTAMHTTCSTLGPSGHAPTLHGHRAPHCCCGHRRASSPLSHLAQPEQPRTLLHSSLTRPRPMLASSLASSSLSAPERGAAMDSTNRALLPTFLASTPPRHQPCMASPSPHHAAPHAPLHRLPRSLERPAAGDAAGLAMGARG
jgi:hypothetical protein